MPRGHYPRKRKDQAALFWSHVDKSGECWIWTAATADNGYGLFNDRGRMERAHRMAWRLTCGTIPQGLCVLHRCDVRPCVRPDHLFLGTKKDNTLDMMTKGRHVPASSPGESNPSARLSMAQVFDIRREGELGRSHSQLAEKYGISKRQVGRILRGLSWNTV